MTNDGRRAAIDAYKERKAAAGIYAVRCRASGETWVGRAADLDKIQNRLWFTLRQGGNPHRALQAAWRAHGAEAFAFEVLERLPDAEASDYLRAAALKDRLAHWRDALGAAAI